MKSTATGAGNIHVAKVMTLRWVMIRVTRSEKKTICPLGPQSSRRLSLTASFDSLAKIACLEGFEQSEMN